jgi:CheY-like chemotaxis protein/two-component sensor histidine kinase
VTRDLTERRRLEILEDEGRQTTEFLAMLGHELRNPLAPIRNALEVLRGRGSSDAGAEWARDLIDRQVSHLTRLVDDLLDMSRVTSGRIELQKERLDLGTLVSQAVESARSLLEERGHALSLALPDEPLLVRGDATRLSQVVVNLVGNAAKYTPPGGQVWVTVRREAEEAVLSVRDDGIGMAPDLVPRVFDLFVQGQRALDRSEGGLGVGLTLVRRLAESHGGTAEAQSAGPGQGSEIVVRLPALSRAAEEPPPAWSAPATQGQPSRRILVVDDNVDSAESMAQLLRIWGHEAEVAHDGPAALAIAAERPPEVVLLDIGLPGMSGYEIAPRLRALPGLADAVIVAMTGYGQDKDFFRSREAGFAVHLVKPIQPEALKGVLADLEASRSR